MKFDKMLHELSNEKQARRAIWKKRVRVFLAPSFSNNEIIVYRVKYNSTQPKLIPYKWTTEDREAKDWKVKSNKKNLNNLTSANFVIDNKEVRQ